MKPYLLIPLLLVLSSTCYSASRTPQPLPEQHAPTVADVATNVLFGEVERQVLADYLGSRDDRYAREHSQDDVYRHDGKTGKKHKQKSLPPGLRKKLERGGELPPGWQQKVARGEVLEEDIYLNHSRSLPEEIIRRLPSSPDGTSIRQIDDRIVRVMDATRTVLDVFYLANPQ